MSTELAWFAIGSSAVLLLVVGVLLFRVLTRGRRRQPAPPSATSGFVPTTPDATMVISRQQLEKMLDK